MIKIAVLAAVFLVVLIRFILSASYKKNARHLLISAFVQMIPYGYGLPVYVFMHSSAKDDYERLGEFGSVISLELPLFFAVMLFFMGFNKIGFENFKPKKNPALYFILLYLAVSLINPSNQYKSATFVIASLAIQLLIVLSIIKSNFSKETILRGTFDGLMSVTILELILSICFPILRIEAVARLFRGDEALEWANRREGYLSAVGTFGHPGYLGLFCLFTIIFFVSCYFNGYKKKLAFYLSAANIFIIGLTFSRTTYVALMAVLIILYINHKQLKSVFSLKNVLVFLGLFSVATIIFYFSPLSDVFLQSDVELQYGNRFAHWVIGYQIWQSSPLIGIGINSHVYQMMNMPQNFEMDAMFAFLIRNPIHNIHMIVLAETGIIGLAGWLYFFYSRINTYSSLVNTPSGIANIFNMSYSGMLSAFFIYGFFGWAPFNKTVFVILIFVGFFSEKVTIKKTTKRHAELQYH